MLPEQVGFFMKSHGRADMVGDSVYFHADRGAHAERKAQDKVFLALGDKLVFRQVGKADSVLDRVFARHGFVPEVETGQVLSGMTHDTREEERGRTKAQFGVVIFVSGIPE